MDQNVLNALAEPTRFRIVEQLREKPLSVNEVVNELGISQPQASKHLKFLAQAGVISVQPIAQKRIYSLNPQPFVQLDDWVRSFEKFWGHKFNNLERYLNQSKKGEK